MASKSTILTFDINALIDHICEQSSPDDFLKARFAWLLKCGSQYVKDNTKLNKALKACGFADKTAAINALNTNAFHISKSDYAPETKGIDNERLSTLQGRVSAAGKQADDKLQRDVVAMLSPYVGEDAARQAVSTAMDGTTGPLRELVRGVAAAGTELFRPTPYTRTGDLGKEIVSRHQYGTIEYGHIKHLRRQQAEVGATNIKQIFPHLTQTEAEDWQRILTDKTVKGLLAMGKEKAVGLLTAQGGDTTTAGLFFDRLQNEGDSFLYGDFGDATSVYYDIADNTSSLSEKTIAMGIASQLASQDVTAETGYMRANDAVAAIRSYRDSGRNLFAGLHVTMNHSELSERDREDLRNRVRAMSIRESFHMDEKQAIDFQKKKSPTFQDYNTRFNTLYDKVAEIAFADLSESETRQRYDQLVKDSSPEEAVRIRRMIRHINEEASQQLVSKRIIAEHKGLKDIQDELGKLEGSEKLFGGVISPEHAIQASKLLGGYGTTTHDANASYARTARIIRAARGAGVSSERLFSMASRAGEILREEGYDPALASIATDLGTQALYSYRTSAGIRSYNAEAAEAAASDVGTRIANDTRSKNIAWLLSVTGKDGEEGRELRALQQRVRNGNLTAADSEILNGDMSQFADQVVGGREGFASSRTAVSMNTYMKNLGEDQEAFNRAATSQYFKEGTKEYTSRADLFMSYIPEELAANFGGKEEMRKTYLSLIEAGGFDKERMIEIFSGTGGPLTPGEKDHLLSVLPEAEARRIIRMNNVAVSFAKKNPELARDMSLRANSGMTATLQAVGETDEQFSLNQNIAVESALKIKEDRMNELLHGVVDTKKSVITSVLDEGLSGGDAIGTVIGRSFKERSGLTQGELEDMAEKGVFVGSLLISAADANDVDEFKRRLRLNTPEQVKEFLEGSGYDSIEQMFEDFHKLGPGKMRMAKITEVSQAITKNKYGQNVTKAVLGSDEEYDENFKGPETESSPSGASGETPKSSEATEAAAPADTGTKESATVASNEQHVYPTAEGGVLKVYMVNNPLEITETA